MAQSVYNRRYMHKVKSLSTHLIMELCSRGLKFNSLYKGAREWRGLQGDSRTQSCETAVTPLHFLAQMRKSCTDIVMSDRFSVRGWQLSCCLFSVVAKLPACSARPTQRGRFDAPVRSARFLRQRLDRRTSSAAFPRRMWFVPRRSTSDILFTVKVPTDRTMWDSFDDHREPNGGG